MEGFLDDAEPAEGAPESPVIGFKRLGAIKDLREVMATHRHAVFHAAIGDAKLRRQWLDLPAPRLTPPIVHPSAVVSPSAKIEEGVFIGPRAVINARSVIGRGTIINSGAIIEHDCELAAFCHIAPGSVLSGAVKVGEDTLIGAGSTVIPGVKIGSACTIGAGAVVISDVADGATAIGVPAKTA
jgi:sugar O-acyltransferase (sialic acid O-acetyltransferase NeuD family)